MSNHDQEMFHSIFTPHNRRAFLKRAGALSLSGAALAAFLESCGNSNGGSAPTNVNMAGPIDMQTLISHAKQEGQLQAIGIPPE